MRQARVIVWCTLLIILDINSIVFPWPGTVRILLLEDGLEACQSGRGGVEVLAMKVGEELAAENTARLSVLHLCI